MRHNPLINKTSSIAFEAPPFDLIQTEDYLPALEIAIKKSIETIEAIASNPQDASMENTIEALEYAGIEVGRISSIFFNLNSACTNNQMQDIAIEVSGMLTDYSNDITLNQPLFNRIKTVYEQRDSLSLDVQQKRLLELTYKNFKHNGASLEGENREHYRTLNKELSALSVQFEQNLLAATHQYQLHLTDATDLAGLPAYVVDMGADTAKEKGVDGWVYTLQTPSFIAFMKFSENRPLREKLWKAYSSRCLGGDFDNRSIIKKTVDLRLKKANILGYQCYSDYALEDRMAESTNTAKAFLDTLLSRSMPHAQKEVKAVQQYALLHGADFTLMPWDWAFYCEKLKNENYALNDTILKPYFELSNVIDGVFGLAQQLYGLTFTPCHNVPVYHPDVKVYEVYDEGGRFMSLLYLDFFPRENKSGGAWMTSYRESYQYDKQEYRPLVSLVCNFTKPTSDTPSLLTFDEVTTYLHEFGHGLHGILAEGKYPSMTGTNVTRDFVELPSQIMENWALEREFLNQIAKHYQTGEVIPDNLVQKIIKAKNFLSGYQCVRQLSFGINDMAWHSMTSIPEDLDVETFEKEISQKTALLPSVDSTNFSVGFAHIFSGGYSAGYYSYKWAEVLEADAFSRFQKEGVFNKVVANQFRETILSQGGSAPAMTLYKNFMGREPQIDALLEKLGLKE